MSTLQLLRPDEPIAQQVHLRGPGTLAPALTRRERIVLAHLSSDVTLEAIASELWVSRNTVKSQVRSLYRKIGVSTRADALAWATSEGLDSPQPGREPDDAKPTRLLMTYRQPTSLVAADPHPDRTSSSRPAYR